MRAPEQLSLLLLSAAVLGAAGLWIALRRWRPTQQDRERRRRSVVHLKGRLGDATITDIHDGVLFYSYSVRGVFYTASQDVSNLRELLPEDPDRLIGPATVKYLMSNPANSIILAEDWSGVRPVAQG